MQATTSPPESLLLLEAPSSAATGASRPDDEEALGGMFLHMGLANGVLLRTEVWGCPCLGSNQAGPGAEPPQTCLDSLKPRGVSTAGGMACSPHACLQVPQGLLPAMAPGPGVCVCVVVCAQLWDTRTRCLGTLQLHMAHRPGQPSPTAQVDRKTGALSDTRTRFLGTRPAVLVPISVAGRRSMLALSSRPWLGYRCANGFGG